MKGTTTPSPLANTTGEPLVMKKSVSMAVQIAVLLRSPPSPNVSVNFSSREVKKRRMRSMVMRSLGRVPFPSTSEKVLVASGNATAAVAVVSADTVSRNEATRDTQYTNHDLSEEAPIRALGRTLARA